jgi:chemotaxis protein CheD
MSPHRLNAARKQLPFAATPGFEQINRFWDDSRGAVVAKILPGEYYVTREDELIGTVLGSCVSACIRDRLFGVGGMNHFMLPANADGNWGGLDVVSSATRYGNFAMEHMINDILKLGGVRSNLEVKIFGGGRIISGVSDVGKGNIDFVHHYLQVENLRLVAEDVGGDYPRKLLYSPKTGKVQMKRLRTLANETVKQRENRYLERIKHDGVDGDIELFTD